MNIIILFISIILIVNANTILIKIKMLMARWEEGVLPWVSPEVSTGSQAAGAPGRLGTWHQAPAQDKVMAPGLDMHDNEDDWEQLRLLAVETRGAACLGESLNLGKRVTDQILNFARKVKKTMFR